MARAYHLMRPQDKPSLNLIVLHLGSGASICAIRSGQSLDTSMGLTPVSGLPGATRSGLVDPSLIFHYTNRAGRITHDPSQAVDVRVTQAEEILNTESGWKALTGTSDFGEIVQKMKEHSATRGSDIADWQSDAKWRLAFDLFVDRIVGFVGAYYVRLGGKVDALVFSGGIGEKSRELREAIIHHTECIGFKLDKQANAEAGKKEGAVVDIGKSTDVGRVLVCRTDEQVCCFSIRHDIEVHARTARDGQGVRYGGELLASRIIKPQSSCTI